MKEIFVLAKSIQEQQIKGERQLNDLHDSVQLFLDKFKKHEEAREKNEIRGNLQSEVRTLSWSFKTWKAGWPAGAVLKKNLSSRTRSQGSKGEAMDDIIIETIVQNLDIDIPAHDIKRSHRNVVKFVQL